MSFITSDLASLGYSGVETGHSLYFFANSNADPPEVVRASGYFFTARKQIHTGDLIYDVVNSVFMQMVNTAGVITVGKRTNDFANLFSSGEDGLILPIWATSSLFSDSAGTIPATVGSTVGFIKDASPNNNPAIMTTSGNRPLYQLAGGFNALKLDGVDDRINMSSVGNLNGSTWTIMLAYDTVGDTSGALLTDNNVTSAFLMFFSQGSGSVALSDGFTVNNFYVGTTLVAPTTRADAYNLVNGPKILTLEFLVATSIPNPVFGNYSGSALLDLSGALRGLVLIKRALTPPERLQSQTVMSSLTGIPL